MKSSLNSVALSESLLRVGGRTSVISTIRGTEFMNGDGVLPLLSPHSLLKSAYLRSLSIDFSIRSVFFDQSKYRLPDDVMP